MQAPATSVTDLCVGNYLARSDRTSCNRCCVPDWTLEGMTTPPLRCSKLRAKRTAKIVALSEPKTNKRKEKTDFSDPDPTKCGHPIIGLVFKCRFAKKSDPRWEDGTVYDPKFQRMMAATSCLTKVNQTSRPGSDVEVHFSSPTLETEDLICRCDEGRHSNSQSRGRHWSTPHTQFPPQDIFKHTS
jgi:Uncharacterized protein conserved in bacteria (DUF2147)